MPTLRGRACGEEERKVFDKAELAAMDAVYTASNGLPDSSMIERLANSLLVEKELVWH